MNPEQENIYIFYKPLLVLGFFIFNYTNMKKQEKNIIIILLILASIIIGVFYIVNIFKLKNKSINQLPKSELREDSDEKKVIDSNRQDLFNKQVLPVNNSVVDIQQNNKASVIVLDKEYNLLIQRGDTVYQVMKKLVEQKENNFSFGFKEYPALGIFVDEINGLKNGGGKYWFYYVNGKEATVGISKYVLESGDIISWELK